MNLDKNRPSGVIMRSGPQPSSEVATPNPFPYVLRWEREGRKGQRCRILKEGSQVVLVEFEDGFRQTMNRMALRRE